MMDDLTDERKQEIADISGVMNTNAGRNTIYRILQSTGLDVNGYSSDTHEHAKNAGRREVGLWLRDEIKTADFGNYLMMMRENEDA